MAKHKRKLTAHQRRNARAIQRSEHLQLKAQGKIAATAPSEIHDPFMRIGLAKGWSRREIRIAQQEGRALERALRSVAFR